jgi:hypothetical protein
MYLILGASYGSLLATKIVLAGHNAKMICLPAEADLFNAEGAIIRTPVKGRDGLVEIRTTDWLVNYRLAAPPIAIRQILILLFLPCRSHNIRHPVFVICCKRWPNLACHACRS